MAVQQSRNTIQPARPSTVDYYYYFIHLFTGFSSTLPPALSPILFRPFSASSLPPVTTPFPYVLSFLISHVFSYQDPSWFVPRLFFIGVAVVGRGGVHGGDRHAEGVLVEGR